MPPGPRQGCEGFARLQGLRGGAAAGAARGTRHGPQHLEPQNGISPCRLASAFEPPPRPPTLLAVQTNAPFRSVRAAGRRRRRGAGALQRHPRHLRAGRARRHGRAAPRHAARRRRHRPAAGAPAPVHGHAGAGKAAQGGAGPVRCHGQGLDAHLPVTVPLVQFQMLPDVVGSLGWTSFTVVYYDNSDLRRVAGLLKMYDYRGYTVTLRQLPAGEDYRSVSGPPPATRTSRQATQAAPNRAAAGKCSRT